MMIDGLVIAVQLMAMFHLESLKMLRPQRKTYIDKTLSRSQRYFLVVASHPSFPVF